MALTVYTNIYSTIAQNNLTKANNALSTSIERLSSGMRINHAADDASGLAISEKLRGQIRGMAKASTNAQDAISYLQTAEGGMEVIGDILQRMRELAVQAGNGAYTSNDRMELQKEVSQLKDEINRISASTEFNTKKILTGESAAIWSTSDPKNLEAVVRGTPAQGNYRLSVEAFGGQNSVYKTDIMNTDGIVNTQDIYNYDNKEFVGGVSKASFANVYGEVTDSFEVRVAASDVPDMLPAVTQGTITVDKVTGRSATGEMSTFDVDLIANNTAADSAYFVLEAVNDGDFNRAGTVSTEDFRLTRYDARTGERTEVSLGVGLLSSNTTWNASPATPNADVGINFRDVSTFAAGDKFLFATQAAIPTSSLGNLHLSNGLQLATGITATAGTSAGFAIAEMDAIGNVSIGRGTVEIPLADPSSIGSVKFNPVSTKQGLYELNIDESISTTVDRNSAMVIGGSYPNGVNIGISNVGAAIPQSAVVAGKALSDNNLNVVSTDIGTIQSTGSIVIEALNDINNSSFLEPASEAASNFKATFIDAATGLEREIAIQINGAASTVDTAKNTLNIAARVDDAGGSNSHGADISFDLGDIRKGDKVLIKQQAAIAAVPFGSTSANITMDGLTIQKSGEKLDDVIFTNMQLDNAGNVSKSVARLSFTDNTSGTLAFGAPSAKVATLDTKLGDISRFTNADGRMVLDNTQTLTLFANGETVDMTMEGTDTVRDFRDKLNQALLDLGLGSGDPAIDANLVRYVTEEDAQASGNLAVAGTFVFQAGLAGDASDIQFIGDQGVLNGLSIAQIQKSENAEMDITVTDAHTGTLVGKDRIGDNMLRGVIKGVDVKINNPQLNTYYNRTTGKISFASPAEPLEMDLHVVDNRTAVQIGANEGQTLDISIGQMDTTALEIDDAYVTTFDASQKAITKFDQALAKVSGARATIGAQVNRLNYTMQNLSVSKMNLIAAESRIRDLDVADESATFARNQVLVNTAIAMLAQANALPQSALQLIG
ncbi:MAG: hypothetical protein LBV04_05960 [Deferribacteraceae bacterium]|jgi:flagellin|nr:hypothetical protein [Deferribacteraceae bacterium]